MGSKGKKRPTIDAYFGIESEEYGSSAWMERNQRQTTAQALELLESNQMGGKISTPFEKQLFLDIGCGTGYSSHTILEHNCRVVGIDLSSDMICQCHTHSNLHLIQADMRNLPLRDEPFDHCISISAFNFAASGAKSQSQMVSKIQNGVSELYRILAREGRIVIEFYPTHEEEVLFLAAIKKRGFNGGMLITEPQTKREKKFLLLKKP